LLALPKEEERWVLLLPLLLQLLDEGEGGVRRQKHSDSYYSHPHNHRCSSGSNDSDSDEYHQWNSSSS
jgi:hypothetical protein